MLSSLLELVGFGLILFGLFLVWVPLAVITAGFGLVVVGFGASRVEK